VGAVRRNNPAPLARSPAAVNGAVARVDLRDELPYPVLAPQSLLQLHFPDPWPVLRVCTDRSPHGSRPSVMALMGFSLRGWRCWAASPASDGVAGRRPDALIGQVFHRPTLSIHTPVEAVLDGPHRGIDGARNLPFEALLPDRMGAGLPVPALLWFAAARRSKVARLRARSRASFLDWRATGQ
jgi:hypothetical protein